MTQVAARLNPSTEGSRSSYNLASSDVDRVWLRHFSKLVCLSVVFLIFAGARVTSYGAGLAVPDWPSTYGENMFLFPPSKWRGNIFYEHSHRLIASSVGFLMIILAVWIGRVEKRRWVRSLAYVALGAVICQGLLGGMTVLFKLPTAVSVSHAVLAQTFLILTIIIAYSQSRELKARRKTLPLRSKNGLFKVALLSSVIIYVQLVLGALMRHTESGLAIPDFPTMGGMLLPTFSGAMLAEINDMLFEIGRDSVTLSQVGFHFAHRVGAVLVCIGVLAAVIKTYRSVPGDRKLLRNAFLMAVLVTVQFGLGVFAVLSEKAPDTTSLHVVGGAVLLAASVVLTLRAYSLRSR